MKILKKKILTDNRGFTLIEIMIVIVVLSIMALVVAPRVSNFLGNDRENFVIFTSMITKTFDDSFLNDRVNYLTVHLNEGEGEKDTESETNETLFGKYNGLSVVNLEEGKFVASTRRILRFREFPDSFRLEEVVLNTGEVVAEGNVLIPFYPQGYSDNVIIHVLVDDEEKWSIRIHKHQKEPEVVAEYIAFEEDED